MERKRKLPASFEECEVAKRALANSKKKRRWAYRLTKKNGQQAQSWLFAVPAEIFERIVSFIERPDDALRLAASCRRAYNEIRTFRAYWTHQWNRWHPGLYPAATARHKNVGCAVMARHATALAAHQDYYAFRTLRYVQFSSRYGGNCSPHIMLRMPDGYVFDHCQDPDHYPRTQLGPTQKRCPDDAFSATCKAISKANYAKYKELNGTHDVTLKRLRMNKQEVSRSLERLKDTWVDISLQINAEEKKLVVFELCTKGARPFIELSPESACT